MSFKTVLTLHLSSNMSHSFQNILRLMAFYCKQIKWCWKQWEVLMPHRGYCRS